MFAGVPCYNLKALYYEIADQMPKPRTLIEAWREMRATWRQQQSAPAYVFDTPVPPIASGGHTGAGNEALESSIGDLAPKGLR